MITSIFDTKFTWPLVQQWVEQFNRFAVEIFEHSEIDCGEEAILYVDRSGTCIKR